MILTEIETRVLGSLIEKDITTAAAEATIQSEAVIAAVEPLRHPKSSSRAMFPATSYAAPWFSSRYSQALARINSRCTVAGEIFKAAAASS